MTVPGNEDFGGVGKADDEPGKHNGFGHALQDMDGNDSFVAEDLAQGDQQGQDHGQTGVDGAGHKVRREDRGVPARDDRQSEIP